MVSIRNEEPRDYEIVENITRNAFYNLYMPGCVEHYLVHIMREHQILFVNWISFWSFTTKLLGIYHVYESHING